MYTRLLVGIFFFSLNGWAVQWQIVGQGSKEPVHQGSLIADLERSAGEITVQILEEKKIPYVGSSEGINSILGTPTGEAAIFVESSDSMRVYGWCYEIDGVRPEVMPGDFHFASQESTLRWFFAFSSYEKGEWKAYCVPAYTKPLP